MIKQAVREKREHRAQSAHYQVSGTRSMVFRSYPLETNVPKQLVYVPASRWKPMREVARPELRLPRQVVRSDDCDQPARFQKSKITRDKSPSGFPIRRMFKDVRKPKNIELALHLVPKSVRKSDIVSVGCTKLHERSRNIRARVLPTAITNHVSEVAVTVPNLQNFLRSVIAKPRKRACHFQHSSVPTPDRALGTRMRSPH